MFKDHRVIIAAMICGTFVLLGLLGVVAWLVYAERPTEAVALIMSSLLVPLLTAVLAKVTTVQHQTNGTNSRLLDAVGVPPAQRPADPGALSQPAPAGPVESAP